MNPASRLLGIVTHFQSVSPQSSLMDAWRSWLEPNDPTSMSEDDAIVAVQAVRGEISSAEARLKDVGAPELPFSVCASRLRNSFSPVQLSSSWSSHQSAIVSESMLTNLQWAAWALHRFDEEDIDDAALDALKESIGELEQLLTDSAIPPGLREMLERQVQSMRSALKLYKIRGVGPLRDAVSKTYGEMATAPTSLVEEVKSAPPVAETALRKAQRIVGKAAELADKGSKFIKFGKDLYELGTTVSHYTQGLLPPPG